MNEINIENLSVKQIEKMEPSKAIIQIELEDGSTDTIQLNPQWAALFFKLLRKGGSSSIGINYCLPEGSPELKPFSRHITEQKGKLSKNYSGWLYGKPSQEV